jgi:DNA primase
MSLTPQFLDEIRSRTLLSALIGKSIKVTKAGREYKACCPFHNEKTPSFTINDDKGFYHCFGCSAHGDAIRWMTDQRGLPFFDAVKELAQSAGMEVPASDPRAAERAERANSLYDVMTAASDWFAEQLQSVAGADARAYLARRGITPATIKSFGLGFAPDSRSKLKAALARFGDPDLVEAGLLIAVDDKEPYDRFRGRLMIPIRDARGRVIAFGGRILGSGEPKYLNSPDTPLFDKGRTLYNLDLAGPASRKTNRIIVVEGYMDVIGLAQVGISDVVAPLGTALTEHQLERLWRLSNMPLICFDGDAAGQRAVGRAAERALPNLANGKTLQFVTLPEGQDPDDLAKIADGAVFRQLLERAEPLDQAIWKRERLKEPLSTPEARAGLKQRLDNLALSIKDALVRDEYRRTFRENFWETFGWRKKEVSAFRDHGTAVFASARSDTDFLIKRAIFLGLSRYPDILYSQLDRVTSINLDQSDLLGWRNLLVEAAYDNRTLDVDMIDTILQQSDLDPIERANFTKDLGFSFLFRRYGTEERARQDLIDVIHAVVALESLDFESNRANERLKAASGEQEWADVLARRDARASAYERMSEFAARAHEKENQGVNRANG